MPSTTLADDAGLSLTAGVGHKLTKKISLGAEVGFYSRNNFRTADRVDLGVEMGYKLLPWLKASANYKLLFDNNAEHLTYNDDGSYNNWRPSYWGARHRFRVSLTGSLDIQRVTLSLRERWQYTYRPAKNTRNFDFDDGEWETVEVRGKGKHVLRSRLQADWDIPHCKFDPFASGELYHGWSLIKYRVIAGVNYKIKKTHYLQAFYRYQHILHEEDDDDANIHLIGLGYTFKF